MDDLMKLGKAFSIQEQESNSAVIEQERIKQEKAAEAERKKLRDETSMGELIESSMSLYNFTYQLGQEDGSRWAGDEDPNFFKPLADIQKDLTERGIPLEYTKRMTEASNAQRYEAILNQIGSETQASKVQDAHSAWTTVPLGVAAGVADPIAWAGALVAPEVTIPAKAVGVGKVLQGAAKGAAAFGAGAAAISIPQYGLMETKKASDVALEIGGGAILGAVAGGAKGAYGAWMDSKIAETKAQLFNHVTRDSFKAPTDVADWIDKYSTKHGVSSELAYAVAKQESSFNKDAKGLFIEKKKDNAIGVFQLMKDAAEDLKVDRFNPEQNVEGGIRYLSQQLKRYNGDEEKALAAYNWGMGNVDKVIKKYGDDWKAHLPAETSDYLRKITGYAGVARKENDNVKAFIAEHNQQFGSGTAGAAQVDGTFIAKAVDESKVENMPEAYGAGWRFDAVGLLKSDENPFLRRVSQIGEDNVGLNKDGSASMYSAEEHTNRLINTSGAQWTRGFGEAFEEFVEGTPNAQRYVKQIAFNDMVTETILTGIKHHNPAVNKAASETISYFKRYADEGFNSGSKYFEGIPPDAKYLPRIINPQKWEMMLVKHGHSDVTKLVREAFLRQLDDAADPAMQKLADKLAQGYVSNVSNRGAIGSTKHLHGIDVDDADTLIPLLENQGLGKGEIQEIIDGLTKRSTDKSAPARMKRRVDFDMTTTISTPDGELRMLDLFETDLNTLVRGYGEQVAGHIGMAKIGIKSEADFTKLMEQAATWNSQNKGTANKEVFDRQKKRAEFLYKAVTRQQLDSTLDMGNKAALRHIRSFNVMRLMNNTGFAQLAEFGNIIGRGGIDAMMELIPAFASLSKDRGKFGRKFDKGFYEELESLSGTGTTQLLGKHYLGWDSMEGAFTSIDKLMHDGKQITSHLSGMAYLMPAMQRMAAGVMTHRFAKLALKEKLTAIQMKELRQLGLDDEMMQRVLSQVKQHATLKGKRVKQLNLEKWGIEERANFGMALQRATRRMVQENSIGGTAPLMHSEMGKLLFQFKSFIMNAWTKQTMAGLALRDARTFMAWATTSFIGGSAYIAQTHLMNYGNDEVLDERLTNAKIGAASFARAGWASLVPTVVDTTVPMLTGGYAKRVFSDTRASGQQADLITGSPAYTLVTTLWDTAPNLWLPMLVDDYEMTERDAKKIIGLMPFVQAAGIRRQLEVVIEDAGLSQKRFSNVDQIDPLEEISEILSSN